MRIQGTTTPIPVERIGDVASHYYHLGSSDAPEVEAWLHAKMEVDKTLDSIERQNGEIPDLYIDTLSFWQDVVTIMKPVAELCNPDYVAHDDDWHAEHLAERKAEIVSKGPDGAVVAGILEGCRSFGVAELVDIAIADIAAKVEFLKTGDRKKLWPNHSSYARDQIGNWNEAQDHEILLCVARTYEFVYPDEHLAEGLNEALASLGVLYANNDLSGRAIALLSVLDSDEHIGTMLDAVVDMMKRGKEENGDEYYQRDYSYAVHMLRPDTLELFKARLLATSIPLIPGSKRILQEIRSGSEWLTEIWDEDALVEAVTSHRTKVTLPFTEYRSRLIMDRGEDTESVMYDRRYSVDFEDLDQTLQARIADKISGRTPDLKTDEELERIVFGFGFTLETMDISSGDWKIMLDHNHIQDDEYVSGDINEIESIEEGWLVTDYSGSYLQMEGFNLQDVQVSAPRGANAFWFSGNPRQVNLPNAMWPEHTKRGDSYGVVVTPVTFYKINKTARLV